MRSRLALNLVVLTLVALAPHAFASASTALAKALDGKVKAVVPSDKKAIGGLTQDGHYVAATIDGRELGLFYKLSEWRFSESLYFAIDLIDDKNNLVIVPDGNSLKTEKTPKNWLWTDYQRWGKTTGALCRREICRVC